MKRIPLLIAALASLALFTADAKTGSSSSSSGGFRSSPSSSSGGFKSSTPSSSGGFKSSPSSSPAPKAPSSSGGFKSTPPPSNVSKAPAAPAPSSGGFKSSGAPQVATPAKPATTSKPKSQNAFDDVATKSKLAPLKDRNQFVDDFKKKEAAKIAAAEKSAPTKYDTEPATRPAHIPATIPIGNTNTRYDVRYDPATRSYGYYNGGSFTALDVATLLAITEFDRENDRIASYNASRPIVVHSSNSGGSVVLGVFIFILIVGGIGVAAWALHKRA